MLYGIDHYNKKKLRHQETVGQYRAAGRRQKTQKAPAQTFSRVKRRDTNKQINLLVDIQAKLQEGKGKGYEQWAKVFNLKEAAKAAFDALKGEKILKVAELSKEYAALLADKKECYGEYKAAREEMIEFQTAKQNIDRINPGAEG